MNLEEALYYSNHFLDYNGVDEAEFKALSVVCSIANIKNSEYHQNKDIDISMKTLADYLWKLKNGEPLQYILGKWDFYESTFFVGKGVLIPRPETEELVEKAIDYLNNVENPIVYDLCSGSGCIGISIAKAVKDSTVYAVEKSKDAFEYLLKNADGVKNFKAYNKDINDEFDFPKADLIISNPPYIKSGDLETLQKEVKEEPKMALDGGKDGLDFYRLIAEKWSSKLKKDGKLMLEIGEDQGNALKIILAFDYYDIKVQQDIYNNDRMVIANKS